MSRVVVRAAALVVLVLAVVGVLTGVAWWLVAPVAQLKIESDGGYLVDPTTQQFIAADGWFVLLTALVGLGAGLLGWWRLRNNPYGAVVGLGLGAAVGAVAAWRTGVWLGRVDLEAAAKLPAGTVVNLPLRLGLDGALAVEAVLALVVWLVLDVLTDHGHPAPEVRAPVQVDQQARAQADPGWSADVSADEPPAPSAPG